MNFSHIFLRKPDNSYMTTYYDSTYTWLCREFPDFHDVNLASEATLIAGKPQAGKSEFTFAIALMCSLSGKIPIMILRNFNKDAVQMQSKFLRFITRHTEYMKKLGYTTKVGMKSILATSLPDNVTTKNFILTMYNGYQLNIMNKALGNIGTKVGDKSALRAPVGAKPYVLLIDEADAVGYGDIIDEEIRPKYHAAYEYQVLLENTTQTYEITATVFDILYGNTNLTTENIVVVRPPPTYKGIRDGVQFIPFTQKMGKWTEDVEIEEADPNMIKVYTDMGNLPTFTMARYSCPIDHPIIVLHKSYVWQKHHDMFLRSFCINPVFRTNWTIIVEDSRACQLYHYDLRGTIVKIGTEIATDNVKYPGLFKFTHKNIDIQIMLQWLIDNGGAVKFHHIIIKTGHQAGRSRSYVSDDGSWHLTHEYFSPSKYGRNTADLIQAVRLCHNRPDSIPLVMFAPEKVCIALQKADMLQDEQLQRLRDIKGDILTSEHIQVDVWTAEKVPQYKLCRSKLHKQFQLTKISVSDGGWDTKDYITDIENIQEGKYTIIDQTKFSKTTQVYKMIADVEKILIDHGKMQEDVEITWVNKQLMEIGDKLAKSMDNIHGTLWTSIRKNKGLVHVHEKKANNLLFWKQGGKGYVCLT